MEFIENEKAKYVFLCYSFGLIFMSVLLGKKVMNICSILQEVISSSHLGGLRYFVSQLLLFYLQKMDIFWQF